MYNFFHQDKLGYRRQCVDILQKAKVHLFIAVHEKNAFWAAWDIWLLYQKRPLGKQEKV